MNCKNCKARCYWAGQDVAEPDHGNCYVGYVPKTNADRVRAMTDEELAEFISGTASTFGEEYEGYMSALDWLKEEAGEYVGNRT